MSSCTYKRRYDDDCPECSQDSSHCRREQQSVHKFINIKIPSRLFGRPVVAAVWLLPEVDKVVL